MPYMIVEYFSNKWMHSCIKSSQDVEPTVTAGDLDILELCVVDECTSQVGVGEVGVLKVSALQVCVGEISSREVGANLHCKCGAHAV